MSARGLRLALQFLTRLPAGPLPDVQPEDLSRSAVWFPAVGALVGALAGAALLTGARIDASLGALCAVVVWVGVTGALHLDGLADLADALGAAHRDRARFLQTLRDPHIGVFGVIALVLALSAKLILAALAVRLRPGTQLLAAMALAGAWSRYGALIWSAWLKPLASGSAQRLAERRSTPALIGWGAALLGVSAALAPETAVALGAIGLWGAWLRARLGGVTGDCLGAGVEIVEIATLLAIVVTASM